VFFSYARPEGWPHHLSLSSVILTDSSTGSHVHVFMLSIRDVRGLHRLRAPGTVPCISSFSRQLPSFIWPHLLFVCNWIPDTLWWFMERYKLKRFIRTFSEWPDNTRDRTLTQSDKASIKPGSLLSWECCQGPCFDRNENRRPTAVCMLICRQSHTTLAALFEMLHHKHRQCV